MCHKTPPPQCDWGTSRLSESIPKGQHRFHRGCEPLLRTIYVKTPRVSKQLWEGGSRKTTGCDLLTEKKDKRGKIRGQNSELLMALRAVFFCLLSYFTVIFILFCTDHDMEVFMRSDNGECKLY